MVLKSSQEKVKNLQQELQIAREKLFDELGNTHATNTWNYLRQENALLHRNLKLTEKRKLEKTIPVSTSDPPTISPDTLHTNGRRYHKLRRLRRKRLRFRRRRKEIKAALNYKAQQLNPINLSDLNINEHQITVLRKGPSFCPSPNDVNWQLVHDDLEAFEARLRTAVFFLEKFDEPEEIGRASCRERV